MTRLKKNGTTHKEIITEVDKRCCEVPLKSYVPVSNVIGMRIFPINMLQYELGRLEILDMLIELGKYVNFLGLRPSFLCPFLKLDLKLGLK